MAANMIVKPKMLLFAPSTSKAVTASEQTTAEWTLGIPPEAYKYLKSILPRNAAIANFPIWATAQVANGITI
jgi:hypothetical protein